LAAPIPDDFGDRLGPVVVKELRQGLRARRFVGPFLLIHLVAVFAVMTEAAAGSVGASIVGSGMLVTVLGLMLCVAMPMSGFGALQPELHPGRNIELLLMANLSRWQIVIGKWLVMCSLAGLILVSLLPYLLIRHYIGGIDIVQSLRIVGGVALINVTMNAAVIGASGFSNYIGRLMVLAITVGSFWISAAVCLSVGFTSSSSLLASSSLTAGLLSGVISVLVAAVYCAYGLQLGRARLRLFENPIDPPASGLLIAMLLFTPLMIGMFSVATGGIGGPVLCLLLFAALLAIDRGPGKKGGTGIKYAQP
jgi:hypothetical protein